MVTNCIEFSETEDKWILHDYLVTKQFDLNQWDFCRCSRKAYEAGWKCHVICNCPKSQKYTCRECECVNNNNAGTRCRHRVCRHRNRTLCIHGRRSEVEECRMYLSWNRTEDSYDECDCLNAGWLGKSGECECRSDFTGILCQKWVPPTYKPWQPPVFPTEGEPDVAPHQLQDDPDVTTLQYETLTSSDVTSHWSTGETTSGRAPYGLSEGVFAGIMVGTIAAVSIAFFFCFCFCVWCLRDEKHGADEKQPVASENPISERMILSEKDTDITDPVPIDDLPPPTPMPHYVPGYPPMAPMYPYPDGPMPGGQPFPAGPQFPGSQPFTSGPQIPAGPLPNYGPQGTPPVFNYPQPPNQHAPMPMFPSSTSQQPPVVSKSTTTSAAQAKEPMKSGPIGKASAPDNKSIGSGSASVSMKSTTSARKNPPIAKVAGKMEKPSTSMPVAKTTKITVSTKI